MRTIHDFNWPYDVRHRNGKPQDLILHKWRYLARTRCSLGKATASWTVMQKEGEAVSLHTTRGWGYVTKLGGGVASR